MSMMGEVHLVLQERADLAEVEKLARAIAALDRQAGIGARRRRRLQSEVDRMVNAAAEEVLQGRCPDSNRRAGQTRAGALGCTEGNTTWPV